MDQYNVGDQFECTEDYYMEESSGGERSFEKGKVYTISHVDTDEDAYDTDVMLIDDCKEEHFMDDLSMKQHFKKVNGNNTDRAYDRAMGII